MSKAKKQKNANKHRALSAQQTIPYIAMYPDGICQLPGGLYTKTLEYEDINYAVASTEDQTAIISGWSACLNYFDSSLPFQLSFVNRRSRNANRYKVNIPAQEDDFNSIRGEYVEMLKGQIAKSNNGIERYKYITFGLPAEGAVEARPRLGRVEADVMGNLKRLGVQSRPLDGRDRLAVLHGQMHPGGREPFRFAWKDIPKTGMGTKDYIAPDSFDFRQSRTFRVGQMWGAASYLQIMASELSDKLLAEILELDAELTVTMHIQTVDQLKAIKTIKGKISDIGRMKAEEQKKAVRAGYDMEILPPDLITFSKDAAELLSDLQSRNERMFLLTFTPMFGAAAVHPHPLTAPASSAMSTINAAGILGGWGRRGYTTPPHGQAAPNPATWYFSRGLMTRRGSPMWASMWVTAGCFIVATPSAMPTSTRVTGSPISTPTENCFDRRFLWLSPKAQKFRPRLKRSWPRSTSSRHGSRSWSRKSWRPRTARLWRSCAA